MPYVRVRERDATYGYGGRLEVRTVVRPDCRALPIMQFDEKLIEFSRVCCRLTYMTVVAGRRTTDPLVPRCVVIDMSISRTPAASFHARDQDIPPLRMSPRHSPGHHYLNVEP